ncbi:cation diffusion facilitator family transporter [Staphylococcus agnetis]|uniref:cation diffusion facilitator family transporter n=1 Tax=Staphylococcus TaxID=1279 RepID=UPI0004E35C7D|nr:MULTISPECIES: cation diffusion facilitator family transporter [Staphylococcus]KFE41152.1 cation efflux family protein [Staphylococcus agnetis]MCO4338571.1 cation diffusion facilitator family transporter [Staphylococcus agnetis]MCO4340207.1 cation diffusion facilitator family transporter [Staphylococcus agnetis]MCO4343793.1 cation diffusion facilitator family transporter [Staphylococcus agnetis]MCO4347171.1 cation diffusion facilitator family transporter [Staphylococcus agnetis]
MQRNYYFHHVEHRKLQKSSKKTLWASLIITLFFTIVEFAGGILSNSLALLSDSFHMLSDVIALGLSMVAIYFASRKPTAKYTFGYLRFEIIAAFLNGLALAIISIWIFYEAIMRIIYPKPVESGLMLVIATIGLIVNIVLTIILMRSLKSENNINIQSALWHFIGDLLNSVGVILAVVLIYFTGIQMIDPILSMVIAVVILRGGYKIMRNAVSILMESVPEHLDTDEIMDDMKRVDQVLDVHEFHLWSITTEHYSLSAHVVLDSKSGHDAYETINKLERLLKEKYGLSHTTLQIEHLEMNHLDEAYFEEIK